MCCNTHKKYDCAPCCQDGSILISACILSCLILDKVFIDNIALQVLWGPPIASLTFYLLLLLSSTSGPGQIFILVVLCPKVKTNKCWMCSIWPAQEQFAELSSGQTSYFKTCVGMHQHQTKNWGELRSFLLKPAQIMYMELYWYHLEKGYWSRCRFYSGATETQSLRSPQHLSYLEKISRRMNDPKVTILYYCHAFKEMPQLWNL